MPRSTSHRQRSTSSCAIRRPQRSIAGRFALWARQIVVDAQAHDLGGVRGDLATMELVRDRFADGLDSVSRSRINASLLSLRDSVQSKDLRAPL